MNAIARSTVLDPLVWIAHILLGVGLAAPCMTITPRLGAHTGLAQWLGLVEEPRTYSILSGIRVLLRGDGLWIGLLLLVFSVLFPVLKLIALRVAISAGAPGRLHRVLGSVGKFSMADVFVVALIVVVSKSFPGGTTVELRWGIYAFAGAALLTMILTTLADRRSRTVDHEDAAVVEQVHQHAGVEAVAAGAQPAQVEAAQNVERKPDSDAVREGEQRARGHDGPGSAV